MSSYNLILYQTLPCLLLLLLGISNAVSEKEEYQTYIIHMDHSQKPAYFSTHMSWHQFIVRSLSPRGDDKDVNVMLYSYNHVMHGFSARLTPSQLAEVQKSPAHVATYQESFGKLYTTYSSEFLGLRNDLSHWPNASYGEGIIIGIIDTGIWPESESFRDKGMPPVPQKWKGHCENGTAFSPSLCNRKLIGARSFSKGLLASGTKINEEFDYNSPRDFVGHGTHVSSTAVGNHVLGVSHFGYARGTARGVAPRAHVAMYKVLFATRANESAASDVLAGMDQAIADGVDIISLSLGFDNTPYFKDVIAIASLSAIEKGILVICAGGNDGSYNSTHNGAPWITTVGAGTIGRNFMARMTLGNGMAFEGMSYYPQSIYIKDALLYYGNTCVPKAVCAHGALNKTEVRGKIVFCDSTHNDIFSQVQELHRNGALAGIFMTEFSILASNEYSIPSIVLPPGSGTLVRDYVTGVNESRVKSMQFVLTRLGTKPAPQVAFFSSRGPDPITPAILKPDILAPGVDILAAVAPNKPYMELGHYELATDYALYSGTSMAAPHVAGVAALLKAVHPEWSPAAIRSSIMTTAYNLDNNGTTIRAQSLSRSSILGTPLDFGAGHINPNKAMEPGLIYDIGFQDYVEFLCSLGYTREQMAAVLRRSQWNCSQQLTDLNYPSFIALYNGQSASSSKKFTRVVTNVGDDKAVYHSIVDAPTGMRIKIEPSTLEFTHKYQTQGFVVSVEIDKEGPNILYGYLKWIDDRNHVVSSPIVFVNI